MEIGNHREESTELDVNRVVPGRGSILDKDEVVEHALDYLNRIKAIDGTVLNTVQKPTSMDEIISTIATKLGVESDVFQHLLSSTTIKGTSPVCCNRAQSP